MRVVLYSFYYLVVILVAVKAFDLSELGIKKCRLEDSECVLYSFRKALPRFIQGIPEYGVEVMDEMVLESVKFEITGLRFTLRDGRLIGDKGIIIDKTVFDTSKNEMEIEYHAPLYILKGHYKTDGRLLSIPIEGDGDIEIRLADVSIRSKLSYDIHKNGTKSYVTIKKTSYEFDVGNAHYNVTNLFRGNKALSDTTLKLINDNSKDLTLEFGKPVLDAVAKKTFKNVKRFLAKTPVEDITITD